MSSRRGEISLQEEGRCRHEEGRSRCRRRGDVVTKRGDLVAGGGEMSSRRGRSRCRRRGDVVTKKEMLQEEGRCCKRRSRCNGGFANDTSSHIKIRVRSCRQQALLSDPSRRVDETLSLNKHAVKSFKPS
jgi:hypothetical protein